MTRKAAVSSAQALLVTINTIFGSSLQCNMRPWECFSPCLYLVSCKHTLVYSPLTAYTATRLLHFTKVEKEFVYLQSHDRLEGHTPVHIRL